MLNLPKVEEPTGLNEFPVLYWNHVALEMKRVTHSLGGPQTGPTMSSRALGLLHLAIHDAFFFARPSALPSGVTTFLKTLPNGCAAYAAPDIAGAQEALCGAAINVLDRLYKSRGPGISALANETLSSMLSKMISDYPIYIDTLSDAFRFGECISDEILSRFAVQPGQIGADQGRYEPKSDRFKFRDEPVNPVKRVPIDPDHPERGTRAQRTYHGPFYGTTVPAIAVMDPDGHELQVPPTMAPDYITALQQVVALGGAANMTGTKRLPDQTVQALYWAYDGANLIGTPPRLYNQIIRALAWSKKSGEHTNEGQNAEFVRLFALINVAMADAGKFAWKEKYIHEFWRPLSGVREHDSKSGPTATTGNVKLDAQADPFWIALGAPETNTDKVSFKPPFPAYPSGHATFGAACFQIARLYYKARDNLTFGDGEADTLSFDFVSDELNGINRDLHNPFDASLIIEDQPGIVRTRIVRHYPSLWAAIFENAISRIYLGVHWSFDAFAATDIAATHHPDGTITYGDPATFKYSNVWTAPRAVGDTLPIGGVPLGLGIANDIWANGMCDPRSSTAAPAPLQRVDVQVKASNTNIR